MKLIIVPSSANQRSARLWLCATDTNAAPPDFAIDVEQAGQIGVPQAGWRPVTVNGALKPEELRTFVQLVHVDGLEPGTRYAAAAHGMQARFSTLPSALPREGERPFTALLGSCFSMSKDRGLKIGTAVENLPDHLQPDVKFLCGDQVYLDYPAFVLGLPLTERGLARSFLTKYLRNWGDTGGLQTLLSRGTTYFTADDHEFWNNYPNAATIISNTWTAGGRRKLKEATLPLFSDFQCEETDAAGRSRTFQAGSVSFFIADTRVHRDPGDKRFMRPDDFADLLDWIGQLQAPGVLVVGQPLFEKPPNWLRKRIVDRTLSNYDQYDPLTRALLKSKYSILVLTGDVHYARIAFATLAGVPGSPRIFEAIASPLALVFGSARMPPDAPDRFPPEAIPGSPQARVETVQHVKKAGDNFALLQFTEVPGRVKVRIRHVWVRESLGQQLGPEETLTLF
jgi:hypothetical protein